MAAAGFVLTCSGLARAQDPPKTGIVIGYPTTVGILWHAGDKVAIRPEFAISGSNSDVGGSSFVTHVSGWGVGVGVSALFYLHTDDHLRTYFVPRFAYTHTSNSTENSSVTASKTSVTSHTYGGSGSFGAEYGLGNRFAVFGELGFEVSHHSGPNTTSTVGENWGTRGGVGVVFYP
jgi:hypothetical protein